MIQRDNRSSKKFPLSFLSGYWLGGYWLAAASTGAAALARWLAPWALTPAPYLGFYPAVVVSAALGGVGPGLISTFASLVLVNFVFGRFDIHDTGSMARQVIWVTASFGVSLLAGMQRSARIRERRQADALRRLNDELEIRVEERTAEIQEANRKLSAANEKLAELDRAKTLFFSNVSHEFRTPLTLLLGPLEDILAKGEELSPANRETLRVAHRNAMRLLRLVNTLLDFSRIEAGRIQAVYEPTDIAVLTSDLASAFRSAVERAGMTLTIDCPPLAGPVHIDREMWEKIVLNLLSNAFKFTLKGGITVRLVQSDERAELSVIDTGIGIASHDLPHLFDRFHRVRDAKGRTFEGTGIGLSLVQELVKLHGGSVSVESVLGRETTFTVSIPLGTAHLPADQIVARRTLASTAMGAASPFVEEALRWLPDEIEPEGEEISGSPGKLQAKLRCASGNGPRPCVLLADDNADMRDYLGRLLEAFYDVVATADGEAALAAALAAPPDLVLSDVMMPGLDGFELLQALRRNPLTATVPVILLSARAGEESRVEGMAAGADDYLTKPFSARELLARVKAHLELARARREVEAMRRLADERLQAALHAESLQKAYDQVAELMEERTRELREKEVLLKEIHHRVKNNLQVISSMVSLQADGSRNEMVREVLRDVTYRVRSMALVHEKLYQSADLARIDFAEYVRSLLNYLWRAHGDVTAHVRLTFNLEPVLLPVDTAVPCGLILNELAGNALKHAFPGRNAGELTVSLQGSVDNRIRLCVKDNGVGLPDGFNWLESQSLGLNLVQMLSGQLGAAVEVSSGDGTQFEIVFSYPEG